MYKKTKGKMGKKNKTQQESGNRHNSFFLDAYFFFIQHLSVSYRFLLLSLFVCFRVCSAPLKRLLTNSFAMILSMEEGEKNGQANTSRQEIKKNQKEREKSESKFMMKMDFFDRMMDVDCKG